MICMIKQSVFRNEILQNLFSEKKNIGESEILKFMLKLKKTQPNIKCMITLFIQSFPLSIQKFIIIRIKISESFLKGFLLHSAMTFILRTAISVPGVRRVYRHGAPIQSIPTNIQAIGFI